MKKFDFFLTVKTTILILATSVVFLSSAQTAKVQLVHNAAALSLDSLDIYLNGLKVNDNMAFRTATAIQTMPSGTYKVNINDRNSTDSGNLVIARFNVSITNNSNNIFMIAGVDTPSNYASNPNGRSTALRLVVMNNIAVSAATGLTALSFAQGSTDKNAITVKVRSGSTLISNAKFGDTISIAQPPNPNTNSVTVNAVTSLIDISNTSTGTLENGLYMTLGNYARKSLFIFTSGFLNPAANQNGPAYGIFATDTAGVITPLVTEGVRMQIMNNTVDTTIDSMDVWMNSTKMTSKLAINAFSQIMTLPVGLYDITLSRKNSTDTISNVLYKMKGLPALPGQSLFGMASGVVNPLQYASNPDGVSTALNISGTNTYREAATNSANVDIAFFNGSIDAPTIDVNRISGGGQKIANDMKYSDGAFGYVSMVPGKYIITITNKDSNIFYKSFLLDLTGQAGKAATLFTSGVFKSGGNPAGAAAFSLNLGYPNGTVTKLNPVYSSMQIVHNSADSIYDSLDVYINDEKMISGLGFRKATAFMSLMPGITNKISIAQKNSSSSASAFYTTNMILDSSVGYYLVLSGVKNPSLFTANPNGRSTAFTAFSFKGAKTTATMSKNVDLLYHHGSTDMMPTTILGYNGATFISKNDVYGDFHHTPYSANPSLDNLEFGLKVQAWDTAQKAYVDTLLIKKYLGTLITLPIVSISKRAGQAGLIFTSGFYSNLVTRDTLLFPKDTLVNKGKTLTPNQLIRIAGMFIAWPDGIVDPIKFADLNLGIKESIITGNNEFHANFYPNPANDKLTIAFELKSLSDVGIEIYDMSGRQVAASTGLTRLSGSNEINLDLKELHSGIYFCSLTINGEKIVKKISVIK